MKNLVNKSGTKATGISVSTNCTIILTIFGAMKLKQLYTWRKQKNIPTTEKTDVVIEEDFVEGNICNSPKICKKHKQQQN